LGQSYWIGGTGDYNEPTSWDFGVPGPFTLAIVQNDSNNVCLIQPGDPAWTHWDLRVADDDGTSGKVVQTGSTNNCNNGAWFRLGVGYDAYGYYILSNGVMNVLGGLLNVGEYGTGYLEVDNGVFNGSGNFNFGVNQITAVGTLVVNGGVVNSAGEMHFGVAGTGHLILHGGSLNVSNALVIGRGDGTGQGDLYMDGGVINKNSTGFVALGMGGGGCTGVITQDGGIFNSAAPIYLGWNGAGTWNLNGGTAALGEVWMGIGASGVFNLNGGNLTASWIHGNNGVFNFNGGTLRAGAASPTWLNGLSAAYVNSGGAIIDTAGYDVSIGQPLLAGGGGLTKLGSGTLLLNAANTYTGATTNAAGILGGAGSLSGPVINQAIATLAPGAGANLPVTFTVNADVTLNAGGFTAMKLYKGGSPVSDQVVCSGTVNYGGELLITSLGTALAQGDTFQLFNAGGQSGNFTAIVGNAGTGNDFSFNPASGVLTIVAGVAINPPNITATALSGNKLQLSWPTDHTGWTLQVQTNPISIGLSTNWYPVAGSTTTNRIVLPMGLTNGCEFYRLFYRVPAGSLALSTDKADGIYQLGETVHWRVQWQGVSTAPSVRFKLLKGGLTEVGSGVLNFTNSSAEMTSTFATPGSLLLEIKWKLADGTDQRVVAGAVAAPESIALSAPRPADFDAFWDAKLQALAAIPANPVLASVAIGNTNLAYSKLTLDNIWGTHIQGQLARPVAGGKFPALLIVQWAGVYPLQPSWVTERAQEGWLVLNIQAHDLPIDLPESFYNEQAAGPLKDYYDIGNDDRDESYFLRMYLSCYRAAEYLTQRADWDGKTLVVLGQSQGGMQSLMTAGLHPRISAALAIVPAGCDMLGTEIGRAPGWPNWYARVGGKDPVQVRAASRYFDVANFTPRITCPVLVGLGLIDEVCSPTSVLAAVNQITSPKEILILPKAQHGNVDGAQDAYMHRCYDVWLPALRNGLPAPVNAP
jgi:cephalosporin-C deacetylase